MLTEEVQDGAGAGQIRFHYDGVTDSEGKLRVEPEDIGGTYAAVEHIYLEMVPEVHLTPEQVCDSVFLIQSSD